MNENDVQIYRGNLYCIFFSWNMVVQICGAAWLKSVQKSRENRPSIVTAHRNAKTPNSSTDGNNDDDVSTICSLLGPAVFQFLWSPQHATDDETKDHTLPRRIVSL